MKFITTWSFRSGEIGTAARKFLTEGAPVPEGATILGRWHKADLSGGFALVESDNATSSYENAVAWSDILELQTVPVLENDEIGPILAKHFGS